VSGPSIDRHLDALKLTLIPEVGPRLFHSLVAHFGSPGRALEATRGELEEVPGIGRERARRVVDARDNVHIDAEAKAVQAAGVALIARTDAEYPKALEYLDAPPPLLYVKGRLLPRDSRAIAVVGSRRCSLYGRDQAERFAGILARAGFTIVSGLARGIDARAHTGALKAGGRTIAVLGNGLSSIYPPEHKVLADAVAAGGALISEMPMSAPPKAENFPRRNRLLSGLSLGVLVIEASQRSGALITARLGAEQGKEVFALPGRVDSPFSAGTHRLIKTGAKLVERLEDILDEFPGLGLNAEGEPADGEAMSDAAPALLSGREQQLLDILTKEPMPIDTLIRESGLEPQAVTGTLTLLELKGQVRAVPGGRFARR